MQISDKRKGKSRVWKIPGNAAKIILYNSLPMSARTLAFYLFLKRYLCFFFFVMVEKHHSIPHLIFPGFCVWFSLVQYSHSAMRVISSI